jgi:hypothetical protein
VFVHTPKEIRTSVHIQHNPPPGILILLPFIVVFPHLNPLSFHLISRSSPLPPSLAAHFLYAMMPQLLYNRIRGLVQIFFGNDHFVELHPGGMGDPLRGEALDIFDSMMGSVKEETPD